MKPWIQQLPPNYKIFYNSHNDPFFVHELVTLSSNIQVGSFTYLHGKTRFTGDKLIKIGNFCSIASEVRFQVMDEHNYKQITTFPLSTIVGVNNLNYDEIIGDNIEIGSDVWIGEGARILSGSKVGDGVVIGAGSVVRGYLEPYGVYSGNPITFRRFRCKDNARQLLLKLKWWNWDINKILQNSEFFNLGMERINNLNESKLNLIIK